MKKDFVSKKIHLAERGFEPQTSRTAANALDHLTTAVPLQLKKFEIRQFLLKWLKKMDLFISFDHF